MSQKHVLEFMENILKPQPISVAQLPPTFATVCDVVARLARAILEPEPVPGEEEPPMPIAATATIHALQQQLAEMRAEALQRDSKHEAQRAGLAGQYADQVASLKKQLADANAIADRRDKEARVAMKENESLREAVREATRRGDTLSSHIRRGQTVFLAHAAEKKLAGKWKKVALTIYRTAGRGRKDALLILAKK